MDIVFGPTRVAVLVDGCFWHGCPYHGTRAASNPRFWHQKIEANKNRDRDTDRRLTQEGWLPIRVWEHENPQVAADHIAEIVRRRRS